MTPHVRRASLHHIRRLSAHALNMVSIRVRVSRVRVRFRFRVKFRVRVRVRARARVRVRARARTRARARVDTAISAGAPEMCLVEGVDRLCNVRVTNARDAHVVVRDVCRLHTRHMLHLVEA